MAESSSAMGISQPPFDHTQQWMDEGSRRRVFAFGESAFNPGRSDRPAAGAGVAHLPDDCPRKFVDIRLRSKLRCC